MLKESFNCKSFYKLCWKQTLKSWRVVNLWDWSLENFDLTQNITQDLFSPHVFSPGFGHNSVQ